MRQKNQQQTQWYTHWRAFLSLLLLSCVSSFAHASNRAMEAWEWIEQGALVVDVRTPAEFQQKHIEGAVNIPLNELAKGFSKIDKSQPIVLYCRSGNRSGQAYDFLSQSGYTLLLNGGGIEEMLAVKPEE
ncbi:rhodanese-like domain-containing protein [Vibrio vulnificus]|uniref:rhodanese-like domain-containing protein n=1 Tax=Vibrio vulnificus TaxID=672 RepID=UPI0001F5BA1C|nr:rhodanese-like domain-containing protein [Vibrio vulnificus]ADV88497.1 phage shock protein E [Vibrio vulnificus MO6-24/O]EGR0040510.1 rhodanese-like domain-containing protein [Vibrio vulnificus]EGR0090701.1 rhodanese-like domain-containing protein [Vibrio vulnificus]EGR0096199.1 rhodanese-like domain-containing protein [Vibrio vulnificus]EGR1423722.1 rhodanese-like domain-containing protein [Vibrio vulnificus]